jgi:AraC-like DNA-binding protein
MVGDGAEVRAWRPRVPGVTEVFHAHFIDHVYPLHTHESWDLMILDDGAVDFALDRHHHGSGERSRVILLPPGVPHDGRTVRPGGFRKRVVYLDTTVLPLGLVGAAVDTPIHYDGLLRDRVAALHRAMAEADGELEAESRLAFIRERLLSRLGCAPEAGPSDPGPASERLARALRDLLDARVDTGLTLAEAGEVLHAHPTHLVRAFKGAFGMPPHAYLTGRRIDRARRLLVEGAPAAEAATRAGFYDQSHLHRHFVRYLGVPPGRYATGASSRR